MPLVSKPGDRVSPLSFLDEHLELTLSDIFLSYSREMFSVFVGSSGLSWEIFGKLFLNVFEKNWGFSFLKFFQ